MYKSKFEMKLDETVEVIRKAAPCLSSVTRCKKLCDICAVDAEIKFRDRTRSEVDAAIRLLTCWGFEVKDE